MKERLNRKRIDQFLLIQLREELDFVKKLVELQVNTLFIGSLRNILFDQVLINYRDMLEVEIKELEERNND